MSETEETKKPLTLQEIAKLQAAANAKLDVLNEAKVRLAKEIVDALLKAYDEGRDVEGVTFELVFPKPAPKKEKPKAETVVEDEDDEDDDEIEVADDEVDPTEDAEDVDVEVEDEPVVEAAKPAKAKAKKKKVKK